MNKKGKSMSKKLMLTMAATVVALGTLTGCASSSAGKNPTTTEIVETIQQDVDLSNLKQGDGEKLQKYYDIKPEDVEEFAIYTPSTNIKADEMVIIKAKDEKDVDAIKEKLEKRAEEQGKSFKDYLPEQYALIQNKLLKSNKNYVIFVISKDKDKIEEDFDNSLK